MEHMEVPNDAREVKRRRMLKIIVALGGLSAATLIAGPSFMSTLLGYLRPPLPKEVLEKEAGNPPEANVKPELLDLDRYAANAFPGGPPKDGIPSIDKPKFMSVDAAGKFLKDGDLIFGMNYEGSLRAYPQLILVWHEIVNDTVGGEKISVTYCPLTGTAIGYKGISKKDGAPLTFGTTGGLVNSNLLMYDRQTDSHWPQMLGIAINGPNKGNVLEEIPVISTRWELWKAKFPDSAVLSYETGYSRLYGDDPYGSYDPRSGYYVDSSIWFPVMANDERYHPKKVFVASKLNGDFLAIPKEELTKSKLANGLLGGRDVVAIYDELLDTVRVFKSNVGAKQLTLSFDGSAITDKETGSEWNVTGLATKGTLVGKNLQAVNAWEAFWFAWVAFFPQTNVLTLT